MELIYTYINNYKGLYDLALPTSSKYKVTGDRNHIKIIKKDLSQDYYSDIQCTLILGKNGVGKTSILDFINSFIYDFEGSGYCIWNENENLIITTSNSRPPTIESDMKVDYIENNENFFRRNKINLVKINNAIDLKNMLVGRKKKKNTSTSQDLSLSYFLQGSKTRTKQLLKKLISFSDNSSWAAEKLSDLNTKFQFEIENSPAYKVNSILKNNEIGDKGLYGATEYFFETLHEKIIENKLPTYVISDLNSQDISLSTILNDKIHLDEKDIIELIFNKHRNLQSHSNQSYIEIIKLMLMPAIIWHLLKASKISKDMCETIYLYCLCKTYLEDDKPSEVIIETLNQLNVKDYYFTKILNLSEYIFETIYTIAGILETINEAPNADFSFTLEEPKQIIELMKLVDKLPSGISSRFRYGWDSLSSGEFAKLNLFNQLYDSIEHSNGKNILILLDECDLYLHPEWQRTIFSEIIDLIKVHKQNKTVQVIFTTHSPILASDFLPSDIIYLEKDSTHKTNTKPIEFGFGATISELYINGFFIEATIGQHAYNYLESIIHNAEQKTLNSNQKVILKQIKNKLLIDLIALKSNNIEGIKPIKRGKNNDFNK
ncbi:AAA family ATPase [Enterobacter ludwigii]|uniref:AAA family ATPase n=1 Tax=Enterobacter ludwigii TaxID=299767 RepID=UPI003974F5D8